MSKAVRNRWVQIGMLAALAVTGSPLVAPHLPSTPQAVSLSEWKDLSNSNGLQRPLDSLRPPANDELGVRVDPDDLVVDARDDLTPAQRQQLNARYGLSLRLNSVHSDEEELLVSRVAAEKQAAILEALRKDPLVEAAEPVYQVTGLWKPDDPRFDEQWNLKMVGAEKAWDRKATGKGVVVAVIDTGVAYENDSRCYQARDFTGTRFTKGYDFVNDDEHPFDDHGHGTHVSGTIAETTDNAEGVAGLAHEATIMPLKVLNGWGSGTSADIADAIRYAADHGAKIINMSLGSPFPDLIMHRACQYAAKKGVLIVCAAGNSGGSVGYPAGFKECLAVSAVGPTGEIARYSSRGREIAVAAPGGDITSGTDGKDGILQNTLLDGLRESDDYYSFQGTSMASPHVAAVAALVMSRGIDDAAHVRQILLQSATPKKPEVNYGAGLLNADRAVTVADGTRGRSLPTLLLTFALGTLFLWLGGMRKGGGWAPRYTFPWLGFVLGYFGPDLVFGWIGFGSPFGIVLHSALIPLYLLWEAESKGVYRFVGAMALGAAVHLAWDALRGIAPFPGVLPTHGIPWLWVNVIVGLGVALVAWGRSRS